MAKYKKNTAVSPETQEEALRIAKATQRPGQTKQQTKLISQGIQKGIELYKKQNKAKARALDKQRKKISSQTAEQTEPTDHSSSPKTANSRWLPWVLLIMTWLGMGLFFLLKT
ncbi:MAG: hypothetical protein CSA50_05870 [Gammaproteobacteria bacterium]|nr:MAG: hypothetical protein CSA50_05870 [Gammaproteobacteria bacterium]